jgi:Tol biopolymer transport system component
MSDTRDLLRSAVNDFEPTPDAFERVLLRRDRKRRNARIGAGIVGIAIFALAALGLTRLLETERTTGIPEPTQPTNGRWVVFSAFHLDPDPNAPQASRGERFDLYVAEADGSARPLVGTREVGTRRGCPTFSPDGSMLAYGQTVGGEKTVVVSGFSSAGELRAPTIEIPLPTSTSFVDPCPVWSPDGLRLATVAPGLGVLIADPNGATMLVELQAYGLVEGGGVDLEWSPDGSQLALLASTSASEKALWLVPREGGVAHRLSTFVSYSGDMTWTPDGRSVVVAGGPCCEGGDAHVEVVDVATGEEREIPLPAAWDPSTIIQILSTGSDRFVVMRASERGWRAPEWLDLQGGVTRIDLAYPPSSFISLSPDREQLLYVTYDPSRPSRGQSVVAVHLETGEATRYSQWSPGGFGDNYSALAWQPG